MSQKFSKERLKDALNWLFPDGDLKRFKKKFESSPGTVIEEEVEVAKSLFREKGASPVDEEELRKAHFNAAVTLEQAIEAKEFTKIYEAANELSRCRPKTDDASRRVSNQTGMRRVGYFAKQGHS